MGRDGESGCGCARRPQLVVGPAEGYLKEEKWEL